MKKHTFYLVITLFLIICNSSFAQCFTSISTRYNHNVGIKPDGSIYCWGWGNWGQLNNGTELDEYVPIPLTSVINWQSIKASHFSTFVIKNDGTLWGCGGNLYGTLGIGSTAPNASVMTQVGTASNWKEIAPADSFTIALKTDNSLWGWGQNDGYQMGNNTCCSNQLTPIQIGTSTDWRTIATSNVESAFAIKNNGTLWCWGSNLAALLGDSSVSTRNVPVQHNPDTDWDKITLGIAQILALKTNNSLWAWGGGQYGETGHLPSSSFNSSAPFQIAGSWKAVGAGLFFSMGIKTDGTLWAWGRNNTGQLGDGTTTNRHIPVQLGTATNWDSVECGYLHTIALRTDGSLWAWGSNDFGQMGNGTTTAIATPANIPIAGCSLDTATFEAVVNTVQVSPNPVKNELTLRYQGNEQVDTIVLYDVLGKEVYRIQAMGNLSFVSSFNIGELRSGTYIVVLKNNDKNVVKTQVIKE